MKKGPQRHPNSKGLTGLALQRGEEEAESVWSKRNLAKHNVFDTSPLLHLPPPLHLCRVSELQPRLIKSTSRFPGIQALGVRIFECPSTRAQPAAHPCIYYRDRYYRQVTHDPPIDPGTQSRGSELAWNGTDD